MTDVSAVSQTLMNMLKQISALNDQLNLKSWYFAGSQTFLIIHGKGTDYYDSTLGVSIHFDGITEDYVENMYYDPRYYVKYVQEYNSNYAKYAIGPAESGSSNQFSVIDLTSYSQYLSQYIEYINDDEVASTYRENALRAYTAAITMNKLELTEPSNWTEAKENKAWVDYLDENLSDEFKNEAIDYMNDIKSELFNLDEGVPFVSYKADTDDRDLWYDTDSEKQEIDKVIEEYKELIDDMVETAKIAAANGGTIINCVSYAFLNVVNSKYNYINVAQTLSCIANETEEDGSSVETVDGSELTDNVNSIIQIMENDASAAEQSEMNKKTILICVIVCLAVVIFWVVELVSVRVYASIRRSKYKKDVNNEVKNEMNNDMNSSSGNSSSGNSGNSSSGDSSSGDSNKSDDNK